MSEIYQLRVNIQEVLVESGLWLEEEVLIKRRTDIWNDIAVATQSSKGGRCLVIGIAEGKPAADQKAGSKNIVMIVTVPITLIELPRVEPEPVDGFNLDEDTHWQATLMLLNGNPLKRNPVHYTLNFESFRDVPDDSYVIRQTVFNTRALFKPAPPAP